ncbi:MAG: heme A synthase [Candidatus Geothermarchaeales archaeon]
MRTLKAFTYSSTVSIYILILIGGYVSATGSGLACPDWPLCKGSIIPELTPPVIIEYTHRLVTILVTILVVAATAMVWRSLRRTKAILSASTLTLALLLAQIPLGMVTVTTELQPHVVTAHLGLATALLASSLYVSLRVHLLSPSGG